MKTTILIFALALSQIAAAKGPQRDRIGNGIGEALELATNSSNEAGPLTLLEKLIQAFEQSEGNIPDFRNLTTAVMATWIMVPQEGSRTVVDLGEKSFSISSIPVSSVKLTGNLPPTLKPVYSLQSEERRFMSFRYEFLGALAETPTGLTTKYGTHPMFEDNTTFHSIIEVRQFGNFILMAVKPGAAGYCMDPVSQGQNTYNGYCGIVYLEMP